MTNARTLQPEDQLAHYRVVGPLGAGGMGEVYLAQDQSLERNVALKVLPPDVTRSEDRVRRFVQEAKSASSLNHPNIVTIYEIGEEPVKSSTGEDSAPVHYISMELITGRTLGAKIHEERTDLRTLLGYLAQAAEGIAKAHAAGIVHRDLKPGNIMISDDGFAKVLDFGLAKLTEKGGTAGPNEATEVGGRTVEGTVMGTVHYMSPEQVQGKPVDARSDIFSFGCLLYEAATRQRPFTAESNVEVMHKIIHERPRPLEELNDKAPAELRRLIRRCLTKAPDQRAQSMKDIAIELREIVDEYDALSASVSTGSGPTAAMPAASAAAHAKRSPLARIAVVVAAVAVLAAAYFAWNAKRGAQEPEQQPFQTMRVTSQTSRGDVIACAISPDGRYLAYIAGRSGRATMRVRQVATGSDVEVIPMQEGNLEFPCFTPDGNYLFFCKRKPDAPLYRVLTSVPSLGGAEQERGFDVDSRVTFSPDGKQVSFVRGVPQNNYTAIVVLDLDTRQERELARMPGPGGPGGPPSWSPDGKFIAVTEITAPPDGGTTVALFDARSGERRDFFTRKGLFNAQLDWLRDGTGFALVGVDLGMTLSNQVFTLSHPEGRLQRVTNDFNQYASVSTGAGDEAIATIRSSALNNLYVVNADGGTPSPITSATNPEQSPFAVATADDRVYYCALRGDFIGIFSVPLTGGEPTALPAGNGHATNLVAAGGKLYFRRVDLNQEVHAWVMNADGSGLRQVTKGTGENLLDVSPDGSLLTFARGDSARGVWIMPTAGGEPRLVSRTAVSTVAGFSSDGKFVGTLQLEQDEAGLIRNVFQVFPVEGGDAVATLRFPQTATSLASSPSDNAVTFIDRADPAWNIYKTAPDGSSTVKISKFTDGRATEHVWSRDGRRVALVRRLADGENVWVINADGSQPRQLTQFSGLDVGQVRWTPDSRAVICSAGRLGNDAVLIRNFR